MPGEDDLRSAILAGEAQGDTFVAKAFVAAAKNSGERSDNPAGGSKPKVVKRANPARIEKKGRAFDFTTEVAEAIKKGTVEIKSDRKGYNDVVYALDSLVSSGVLEKENGVYSAKKEKGQKIIDALKDREDTRYLVEASAKQPVKRVKRKTVIEKTAQLIVENEAALKEMEDLANNPNFHKQTKEEFEKEVRDLRLGDKLKTAEAKKADTEQQFASRLRELENEIRLLRNNLQQTKGGEKADEILEKITEKKREEREINDQIGLAEKEVKEVELEIQLKNFLDEIKTGSEFSIQEIASSANNPNTTLQEILSYSEGLLTPGLVQELNEAVRSGLLKINEQGELETQSEEYVDSLKEELRKVINRNLFAEMADKVNGEAELSSEGIFRLSVKKTTNVSSLIGLAGDGKIMDSITEAIEDGLRDSSEVGVQISGTGELVALNAEGQRYIDSLVEMIQNKFREKYVKEIEEGLKTDFYENDPLYKHAQDSLVYYEKWSQKDVTRWHEKLAKCFTVRGREEMPFILEREQAAREAIARQGKIKAAEKIYDEEMTRFIRDEAEMRANLIEATVNSGDPNFDMLIDVLETSREIAHGRGPNNRWVRRLAEELGQPASRYFSQETHLLDTQTLLETYVPKADQEVIMNNAKAATAELLQRELIGQWKGLEKPIMPQGMDTDEWRIQVTEDDLKQLGGDNFQKYIHTFLVQEAAIRYLNLAASSERMDLDSKVVRDMVSADLIRNHHEAKEYFKNLVREVAVMKNMEVTRGKINDMFDHMKTEYYFDPNTVKEEVTAEVLSEIQHEVQNAYTPEQIKSDAQPLVRGAHRYEEEADIDDSLPQMVYRENLINRQVYSSVEGVSHKRTNNAKRQSIWSILFGPWFEGGSK